MEEVEFQPSDSTYHGVPLNSAFPPDSTYAGYALWYASSQPIRLLGGTYVKYGLPRVLGPSDVVPVGIYLGVQVFAEPAAGAGHPEVIYLPTRPGCEFQAYQRAGMK
jgi:hypothetical protein